MGTCFLVQRACLGRGAAGFGHSRGRGGICGAAAEHLPCVPSLCSGLLQAHLLLVQGDTIARLVCGTGCPIAQPLLRPCSTLCVGRGL